MNSYTDSNFIPRVRIDRLFDNAARGDFISVIAGMGYGKTQAVYNYIIQQPDAVVRWNGLTENDNISLHFWENLTHYTSNDNRELADKMRDLGFPETHARFKQFAEILKTTEHRSHKKFLVFDDFHLINSEEILTFIQRCAHLKIPGACIIIISRNEPDINIVSLFSNSRASRITEDELRFTEVEIMELLKSYDITFSVKEIPDISDSTNGWALAIKLLSLVLKKRPDDLKRALEITRQNIYKILETEIFGTLSKDTQNKLIQLSFAPDLPLSRINETFYDDLFSQNVSLLAPFVWFDSFISDYRMHPVFLEFLQSKQHLLSDAEKQELYRRLTEWCFKNEYYTYAVKYCAMSRQYERMIEVLLLYPFRMPGNTCKYFLNIIEGLDTDDEDNEKSRAEILILKALFTPILLTGIGKVREAEKHSLNMISQWESIKTPISYNILSVSYSNLAYIGLYTGTVTHSYEYRQLFKKAMEYRELTSMPMTKPTGAFAVADIRSFACIVGEGAGLEDFDRFINSIKETSFCIAEADYGMYYGYDDLAACELAFFMNQSDKAKGYARNAIEKALKEGQYSIASMANGYLLRMAIYEGDYSICGEILRQLEKYPDERVFWNRGLLYDLITGFFYAQVGVPEVAASWLTMDEKEQGQDVRIPVRELIVSAKCNLADGKFEQTLMFLSGSYPREPIHRFRLGELTLTILLSLARLKTGDTTGAVMDFEKAYVLSYNGVLEMPFIELGRNFHPLAVAVSKHNGNTVAESWLKKTERKASAYAKKAAVIKASFKREKHMKDDIKLSDREREILDDLYHGLSRDEMAATRYLSINTVNKILQSLFIKLDASNNVDAIRIALDNALL